MNDLVLFSYNGRLAEAIVSDLFDSMKLPLIRLQSLDGKQGITVTDKEVCKIHLQD